MVEQKNRNWDGHGHLWMFGVLGLAAGLVLLVYVPTLKPVAESVLLFAGFHIVGGIVLLATAWYAFVRDRVRRGRKAADRIDFGWDPSFTNGLAVAALIALAAAVAVQAAVPGLWPVAWLLLLTAASFFAGFLLMRGYRRADFAVLPVCDFLSGPDDVVLDAGCGAGRTSIALAPALGNGRIVALDRFDAAYIQGGGRTLIERNLRLAGLSERVRVEQGDLTAIPFADSTFDSVVSTNVYDHLGPNKEQVMRETARVLRPGGRFLVGLSVPGWAMFTVGNVLSFFLTSRRRWMKLAARAGLEPMSEWNVNGTWFVLLAKPGARRRVAA